MPTLIHGRINLFLNESSLATFTRLKLPLNKLTSQNGYRQVYPDCLSDHHDVLLCSEKIIMKCFWVKITEISVVEINVSPY